jgi:hypothetical protein
MLFTMSTGKGPERIKKRINEAFWLEDLWKLRTFQYSSYRSFAGAQNENIFFKNILLMIPIVYKSHTDPDYGEGEIRTCMRFVK